MHAHPGIFVADDFHPECLIVNFGRQNMILSSLDSVNLARASIGRGANN